MPRAISGSTVVLTGASSGIARAAALAFAGRGANVVVAARTAGSLEEVASQCRAAGGGALAVPTDVADEAAVQELARRAHEAFGRIDAWVNAAAVIAYGEFEKTPFVVSKFGVRAFSECLQEALWLERGTHDIHVCTILPQSVDTPIFSHGANYTTHAARGVPPSVDPARVVRAIVRSVEHPRRQRTVAWTGRALELGHALVPAFYSRLVPKVMNVAAFTGEEVIPGPGNVFSPTPELNGVSGGWRWQGALRHKVLEAVLARLPG